ncbi:Aspartic proteinase [Hordeum vulgare]|nr:Aspartic proteinase [Hordeum vulgare]
MIDGNEGFWRGAKTSGGVEVFGSDEAYADDEMLDGGEAFDSGENCSAPTGCSAAMKPSGSAKAFGRRRGLRTAVKNSDGTPIPHSTCVHRCLLTVPKSVGYEQNPLSVYYCYDAAAQEQDEHLKMCIAEVTNTPRGEKVMFTFQPCSDLVAKPLHVSPFMTRPQKVCSQIGLCVFDGSHSVSNQIESVVNKKEKRSSDLLCTACEMTVVWIQNQLRKNQTEELILQYANQEEVVLDHKDNIQMKTIQKRGSSSLAILASIDPKMPAS